MPLKGYAMHLMFGVLVVSSNVAGMSLGLMKRQQSAPAPQMLTVPVQFGSSGQYQMPVNMATGPGTQNFNFTMTTGSGLTYVAGTSCQTCGGVKTYNQAVSTTAQNVGDNATANFLGGTASGPVIKEICALKTSNGSNWNYPNQTVLVVDQTQSNGVASILNGSVSGVVGLGTNGNSQTAGTNGFTPNFLDSIYGQYFKRNPAQQKFTFGMTLLPPSVKPDPNGPGVIFQPQANGGTLDWLGLNPALFDQNQVQTKPATTSSTNGASQEWTVALDGWSLSCGSTSVKNAKSVTAAVEPMYNDLFFPLSEATLFHSAIPGSAVASGRSTFGSASQAWSVPCNTQYSFGFIVGTQTFTLDTSDLIVKQGDGSCLSAIEGWTDTTNSQYLLGARFISSVYLIFTVNNDGTQTVGFAPLASKKSSTNVGAIVGGVIGGVAFLLVALIGGFFLYRYYKHRSDNRATQGQFDPDLGEEAKPNVVPYTVGVPSSVGTSSVAGQQAQYATPMTSPGFRVPNSAEATDPLLSDTNSPHSHSDILPPAYEASEGSYGTPARPPIREKGGYRSHNRNTSAGSANSETALEPDNAGPSS
ncbi:aspartic peptidase domain-containing protein [Abortiporus biennis]|nr:aspartic peptidase domain-containing protein [Abortiporus biennis]